MKFKLRPYQLLGIERARQALREGHKRIVFYLPTGGGKTAVSLGIIEMARAKGNSVAFVCNRVQLINQTSRVFRENGIEHGIIQGENTYGYDMPVIICSIQTIARRGMPAVQVVIVDECHGASGTRAYHDIFVGKTVVGLTATPYQKGLGRSIKTLGGPLFETVVCGATMQDLTDQKYLVPAEVWGPPGPDLSGVTVAAGEYVEASLAEAVDKPQLVGDVVSHWLKIAPGTQTMVFAVNIAHSQHLRDEFRRVGVDAVHVDYHMTDDEKNGIYERFRECKFPVLCNCALLSEGADFPAAECLVLARPTKSRVRFAQMVGRVLRPAPGKIRAVILDHGGCFQRLGCPWDFPVDHLDDGKTSKSGQKLPDPPYFCPACYHKCSKCEVCPKCGHDPTATPCQCGGLRKKGQPCPDCGYQPTRQSEIAHSDGELVQIAGKKRPQKKKTALLEIPKCEIYAQLLFIARKRGYKGGWVARKYHAIYGVWPSGLGSVEPAEPTLELSNWIRCEQIKFAYSRR